MAKRTIVIEPGIDQSGAEVLRLGDAQDRVLRLMGTLAEIGGVIRIVADRVKLGELPGPRPEPVAETVGFFIEFDDKGPLHASSATRRMMDLALATDEPQPAAPAPAAASLATAITDDGGHADEELEESTPAAEADEPEEA